MKLIKHASFAGLAIILALSSCTMEKRLYMSGYNMNWNKSSHTPEKYLKETKLEALPQNQIEVVDQFEEKSEKSFQADVNTDNLSASIEHEAIPIEAVSRINHLSTNNLFEECDDIIIKNGDEIKAKVIEINSDEIKYKKCDNLNGPTYTLKKSEVFMIKYPNGSKDVITPNSASPESASTQSNTSSNTSSINNSSQPRTEFPHKKNSGLAVVGFILGLVGFFTPLNLAVICEILALIFGLVSLAQIKKNPELYSGRGMARASMILGIIGLGIVFLIAAAAR